MADDEIHEHARGGVAFAVGAIIFAPVWLAVWVLTLPARIVRRWQSIKPGDCEQPSRACGACGHWIPEGGSTSCSLDHQPKEREIRR